jgi:dienelactone hydrolase
MGRHIIGYEVQKTLAAIDWLIDSRINSDRNGPQILARDESHIDRIGRRSVGVMGYGEGGLIALYAAACDTRIDAAAISGYFQPRESLWREPIYRNVFGLLSEFGDAEIASLIAPRSLIVEASRGPEVPGPPQTGRTGAASGAITSPVFSEVRSEVRKAQELTAGLAGGHGIQLIGNGVRRPGTAKCIVALLQSLSGDARPLAAGKNLTRVGPQVDVEERLKRQFMQLANHTQTLMLDSPDRRSEFWSSADFTSVEKLESTTAAYRTNFISEILGELPPPTLPPSPRSRQVYDAPAFTGYEVTLDLYPDIFAYGILLVPKGIQPGEKRAVVVCQHGLEGRPQSLADPDVDNQHYHKFACRLSEQGYITFSPQNPYIGGERFRQALRKAQPLKLTLWSFIVRQHERILEWLSAQPNVDPARIAFYGLSYGGKTAMRVPAVLPGYCLSICSADYNEWIWKNVSMRSRYSYLLSGEYDMPEFNLGNTFNYAEMSWLICPRPFMVERGMHDGVAPDEWVAYEYARTRRVYELLGLGDRTAMEVFNGPHTINGVGTFQFLKRHLGEKT